jgi:NADH-quinone oxidoreductase subunit A
MIENALIVVLLFAVCIVMDIALLILSKILPMYYPSEVKQSRWESGNLPIKNQKFVLPMQYFGYMFMFMAAEPILVVLFLFSAYPRAPNFIIMLLLSLLLLVPAVYLGYQISNEMASQRYVHR